MVPWPKENKERSSVLHWKNVIVFYGGPFIWCAACYTTSHCCIMQRDNQRNQSTNEGVQRFQGLLYQACTRAHLQRTISVYHHPKVPCTMHTFINCALQIFYHCIIQFSPEQVDRCIRCEDAFELCFPCIPALFKKHHFHIAALFQVDFYEGALKSSQKRQQ